MFRNNKLLKDKPKPRGIKVFISYSRKDKAKADWLTDSLKTQKVFKNEAKIEVLIDKDERRNDFDKKRFGIFEFEDWWRRIEEMILSADTIIFLVSPDFISSQTCQKEVLFASNNNKKLAPIICEPTPDQTIPEELRRLDWVDLTQKELRADSAIRKIVEGISTNIDWIREHTRLTELAMRWSRKQKQSDLLLHGSEIVHAMSWRKYCPSGAPNVSQVVLDYIRKSQEEEARRARNTRRLKTLIGTLGVVLAIAYFAWRNEAYLREKYFWFTSVREYVLNQSEEIALIAGEKFAECVTSTGRVEALCPEMVVVPPGAFNMGANKPGSRDNEKPVHKVEIDYKFSVSKYEVTADQWNVCVATGGCPEAGGVGEQPINGVSWHDAVFYVRWLSKVTGKPYRLPSEVEWEYIARAGSTSDFYWGDEIGVNNANCKVCGSKWDNTQPALVGSFGANMMGFYDIHGNVWEWVADNWHDNYNNNPPVDGSVWIGLDGNRVVRGGGWYDEAINIRVSSRFTHGLSPEFKSSALGFRVARDLE